MSKHLVARVRKEPHLDPFLGPKIITFLIVPIVERMVIRIAATALYGEQSAID